MRSDRKRGFLRLISREIAIEYKACLYFACAMFFYSAWLILGGRYYASVAVIWEIVLTAYAVGYMQVYLLRNFDEAERIGRTELVDAVVCCCIYAGVSFGLGWFERGTAATLLFAAYMLLCYLCVFLCNKIKRDIDTKHLNRMLEEFKKGEAHG